MTLPPDGVPGHADVDWADALTHQGLPGPDFVRPKPVSSHLCDGYFDAAKKMTASVPTILSFRIAVDGSVKDVRVSKSSGDEAFDREGALCAAKWRYESAKENGKAVEANWSAAVEWARP